VSNDSAYPVGVFDHLDHAVRLARRLVATSAPTDPRSGRLTAMGSTADAARYLRVPAPMVVEVTIPEPLVARVRQVLAPLVPDDVARMAWFPTGDSYLFTRLTADLVAGLAQLPPLPMQWEYDGPMTAGGEDAFLAATTTDRATAVWRCRWPDVRTHGAVQVTINSPDIWIEERSDRHTVHVHVRQDYRHGAAAIATAGGARILGDPCISW
jgi:hypothetical protein